MIEQNKLLDLLLYAVNEANGWHDDHNGSGIWRKMYPEVKDGQ